MLPRHKAVGLPFTTEGQECFTSQGKPQPHWTIVMSSTSTLALLSGPAQTQHQTVALARQKKLVGCDLSGMSRAPAWPPPPLNWTRKAAGAAMAVTTPMSSPSRSSKGPCSMCSSTKAETVPLATFVLSSISCGSCFVRSEFQRHVGTPNAAHSYHRICHVCGVNASCPAWTEISRVRVLGGE